MSSRSSNSHGQGRSRGGEALPVGRVAGHRGRSGELTVRVAAGDAAPWVGVRRVILRSADESDPREFVVEDSRGYRDRLVLKLAGIDDGNAAEGLRGRRVSVALEDAPEPPAGFYHSARLPGLQVVDEVLGAVGQVVDVLPTAGTDLLVVEAAEGNELMIPMAPDILLEVDHDAGVVRVRMPEGLVGLNATSEDRP